METLEYLTLIPLLYLALKGLISLHNESVDSEYQIAKERASMLLGDGQKSEAYLVMENANRDYKRSYIRKVLGYKVK